MSDVSGLSGEFVGMEHRMPIRVYWEDTDGGGVVYHARYLNFAERARTEVLRQLGVQQQKMLAETGVAFALRRASIDFRAPARLDDLLDVRTRATGLGAAILEMQQEIWCHDRCLCVIEVQLVCVNRSGRPVRLPQMVKGPIDRAISASSETVSA
ncbi:MAG: tol-pal system-associated acyl-CoA thioesterase [Pseudomonadota bacterium]